MSYHLSLCKSLSYKGIVSATKKQPDVFVEDKATAEAAVATGYFVLVEDEPVEQAAQPEVQPEAEEVGYCPEAIEKESEPVVDYESLSKKTKAELTAYADANGIDVSKCNTKAEILEEISVAHGGSRTMIGLQEV